MNKKERKNQAKKIAAAFIRSRLDGGIFDMLSEESVSFEDISAIEDEIKDIIVKLESVKT